jgi:hypothetical protein
MRVMQGNPKVYRGVPAVSEGYRKSIAVYKEVVRLIHAMREDE